MHITWLTCLTNLIARDDSAACVALAWSDRRWDSARLTSPPPAPTHAHVMTSSLSSLHHTHTRVGYVVAEFFEWWSGVLCALAEKRRRSIVILAILIKHLLRTIESHSYMKLKWIQTTYFHVRHKLHENIANTRKSSHLLTQLEEKDI